MVMRLRALGVLLVVVGLGCGHPPSTLSLHVLTVAPGVAQGEATDIALQVERTGPEAPVRVTLHDPPLGMSAEPLEIPVGQTSATLRLKTSDQTVLGDSVLELVATHPGQSASALFHLQVTEAPPGPPIVAALEQQTPLIVEKGKPTGIAFRVDRSGGFAGGFRVELVPPGSKASMEPVTVAPEATRFSVTVTLDDHLLVNSLGYLKLKLVAHTRVDYVELVPQVSGPIEEQPLLTSATPDSFAVDAATHLTLRGTGLSGTTSVSVTSDNGVYKGTAMLLSASATEVQADLRLGGDPFELKTFQGQLTVQTQAGTATWPVVLSRIYVDPLLGSDTTGSGSTVSPFASLPRAAGSCEPCPWSLPWPRCSACTLTLAPGVHRPGSFTVDRRVALQGTGELCGSNPSVIESTGEDHRFVVRAGRLRQVKISGYKKGLEAESDFCVGAELLYIYLHPDIADVWVTGGDSGPSECGGRTLQTEHLPLRGPNVIGGGVSCSGL